MFNYKRAHSFSIIGHFSTICCQVTHLNSISPGSLYRSVWDIFILQNNTFGTISVYVHQLVGNIELSPKLQIIRTSYDFEVR